MDAFADLSKHVQSETKLGCLLCKAVSIRVYHLAHLDPARRKSRTSATGFPCDLFFYFFLFFIFFWADIPDAQCHRSYRHWAVSAH